MRPYLKILIVLHLLLGACGKKITFTYSEGNPKKIVAVNPKVIPTDESSQDSTFTKFRQSLQECIKQKDTTTLFSLLSPSIIVSYGGGIVGINEFSKEWGLHNPKSSKVWSVLEKIVGLGGTFEGKPSVRYFNYPYTSSEKLLKKFGFLDPHKTVICISSNTSVFVEPNITSRKIADLRYDIVQMNADSMKTSKNIFKGDFLKIRTFDHKVSGYVKSIDIVWLADRRLIIKKNKNGNWEIESFAPFD